MLEENTVNDPNSGCDKLSKNGVLLGKGMYVGIYMYIYFKLSKETVYALQSTVCYIYVDTVCILNGT